jgi:hypothetical protein
MPSPPIHRQGCRDANEAAGKVKQGGGKLWVRTKCRVRVLDRKPRANAQQLKGDAKNVLEDGINKVADAANKKL